MPIVRASTDVMLMLFRYMPKELSDEYRIYKKAEAYWSKWFGHDREGNPKGIVEFSFLNDDFEFGGRENGGNIYD